MPSLDEIADIMSERRSHDSHGAQIYREQFEIMNVWLVPARASYYLPRNYPPLNPSLIVKIPNRNGEEK